MSRAYQPLAAQGMHTVGEEQIEISNSIEVMDVVSVGC